MILAFHLMLGKFKRLYCYNKQKAHGPYRSPEKQAHSINTFAQSNDYAITLREKIISYLTPKCFIIYKTLSPLHIKINCAKFGWNWSSSSVEDDVLILSVYFCYFILIFPCGHSLNKHESSTPKNVLCQVWSKLA